MPQSKEFWAWAKQMREYEEQTREDQRVYLCILKLVHGTKEENNLKAATSSLERKGLHVSMPEMIKMKKWHEIGTVNRHWGIEVRGNMYELHRDKVEGKFVAKFRKRGIAQLEDFRKRLTARLYVGQTHMTDKIIVEIASGLIELQRDYQVQMDNCQHFAAVLLPRILCANHCHMTVMPSASFPFVKHSEFGLLQAGTKSGRLSTLYYRFLHETKYVVWQNSKYYFKLREGYKPDCNDLDINPYRAVTRHICGNFAGRNVKLCTRGSGFEKQRTIRWDPTYGIQTLDDEKEEFPDLELLPKQRTFGVWIMHHINDWTDALGWTPEMFNEWLGASEGDCSLLIEPPDEYFSTLRAQQSTISLQVPQHSGSTTPQRGFHSSLHLRIPRGYLRPDLNFASSASESSESFGSVEMSTLELEAGHGFGHSPISDTESCISALHDQCSSTACEDDRSLAEAMQRSEQEAMEYGRRRTLEDEDLARSIEEEWRRGAMPYSIPELTFSEDTSLAESLDCFQRDETGRRSRADGYDRVLAANLQSALDDEASRQIQDDELFARELSQREMSQREVSQLTAQSLQQIQDDEELARNMSRTGLPEFHPEPTTVFSATIDIPLPSRESVQSIDSLYTPRSGHQRALVPRPLAEHISGVDDVPAGKPPSYEDSLTGFLALPTYTPAVL